MTFKTFAKTMAPKNEQVFEIVEPASTTPATYCEVVSSLNSPGESYINWIIKDGYKVLVFDEERFADGIVAEEANTLMWKNGNKYYAVVQELHKSALPFLQCGVPFTEMLPGDKVMLPFFNPQMPRTWCLSVKIIQSPFCIGSLPEWGQTFKEASGVASIRAPFITEAAVIDYALALFTNYAPERTFEIIDFIAKYLCNERIQGNQVNNICQACAQTVTGSYFSSDGKLLINTIGNYLIDNYHIVRDEGGRLFYWSAKKKIYVTNNDDLKGMITHIIPDVRKNQREEIIEYCKTKQFNTTVRFNKNKYNVVFKNGIVNAKTGHFRLTSTSDFENIQLSIPYKNNFTPQEMRTADEFFATATCGDRDIEKLLYEAIGYALIKTSELNKFFILTGKGRNGKSTYLDIIKAIMGSDNYATVSFKDFNSQFRTSALCDKLASFAGDVSSKRLDDTDILKSVTAAEAITVERKYENAFSVELFATMFFSCNELPPTNDISDGMMRRIVIVPFNANLSSVSTVDGNDFHERLMSTPSLQYIAYRALEAIRELYETTHEFTVPNAVKAANLKYMYASNSVIKFFVDINDKTIDDDMHYNVTAVYDRYKNSCEYNGQKPFAITKFEEVYKSQQHTINSIRKLNKKS